MRVPCDLPKSKGGINFLDLQKLARTYKINFPKGMRKRKLCELINEKIQQTDVAMLSTTGPAFATVLTTRSDRSPAKKSTEKVPQLTSLYKMVRRLGEGTFGAVWEAVELKTGHVHALKLLKEVDDSTEREVTTLVEMSRVNRGKCHKNILCYNGQFAAIHQLKNDEPERVYQVISTDMVPGKSLEKWTHQWYVTNKVPPPANVVRKIARGLLRALVVAHEHGIYHLDIKPANIMMREKDNDPVLIDFGLSCTDSAAMLRNSTANRCDDVRGWGTLLFMSPQYSEQCRFRETRRAQDCDAATLAGTDIWAAGLSLLSIVHNEQPLDVIAAHHEENAKYVSWLKKRSWLPRTIYADDKQLATVIDDALAPEEEDRPPAKQLLSMLDK